MMSPPPTWYGHSTIYCVDVARFKDSNGDGYGDFVGLTQSLDYLKWLGIEAIWLLPFYRSPRRDNGYDVIDHYEIDHRIGETGDFVAFLREAEHRGIRVIIDLVINHSSNEHRWFQSARKGPSSPHYDWYVWTDDLSMAPDYEPMFPPEEESTWSWDESAQAWYLHHFYSFQPDLNTDNPELRQETRNMVEYWIRLGVRGFRVDGARFLGEKGKPGRETAHELLHDIHVWADSIEKETILIPEVDLPAEELAPYANNGDAQMLFNFLGRGRLFIAMATEQAEPIKELLEELPSGAASLSWLNFLRNHDELTLEHFTDEERQQVYDAFAPDPDMLVFNRGIRRRLAPMLNGDRARIELAFSMLFALPGTPMILNGDEIGMGENLDLPGRGAVRLPMQWAADEPNGGFSEASEEELVTPVLLGGPFGANAVNVAKQREDEGSFLHWIRTLIAMREQSAPFMVGSSPRIQIPAPSVLVLAYPNDEDTSLVTVHNIASESVTLSLDGTDTSSIDVWLKGGTTLSDDEKTLTLGSHGYIWWEQEGTPELSSDGASDEAELVSVHGEHHT